MTCASPNLRKWEIRAVAQLCDVSHNISITANGPIWRVHVYFKYQSASTEHVLCMDPVV